MALCEKFGNCYNMNPFTSKPFSLGQSLPLYCLETQWICEKGTLRNYCLVCPFWATVDIQPLTLQQRVVVSMG